MRPLRDLNIPFREHKNKASGGRASGFCLSGGVDSSAIVSIAQKVFNYDVATFSIIDSDPRYNEYDNIKATIDDLRCKNTIINIEQQGTLKSLRI